ncbi:hypothetical protein JI747_011510 [Chryseobacterium sp. RG1]|uniref:Uncharacterized protein n=1 Tax=Chryseobacterium tagetis TaxID=2801334 RepID=A0ABS8A1E5_9FLAO|nr:hypothetical protein [Chryseobacterium tagetis]MCA6067809.1 hypothetical protein [Chryseobacterium tagetis]
MNTGIIKKFSSLYSSWNINHSFFNIVLTSHSKFDVVYKPNDKMIAMINAEIDKEKNEHIQSIEYKGYIQESRHNKTYRRLCPILS